MGLAGFHMGGCYFLLVQRASTPDVTFWDGTQDDLKKCMARLSVRFTSLFDYALAPSFTEHDLRHEACCRWVMLKGERGWLFNELEICKIMGWTDTKMMLRYASLRGEDLADRLI